MLLTLSGCATTTPDFTITGASAGPPLVGFGAQMNACAYCAPNDPPTPANESNLRDYEDKVLTLSPQHVRIFVQPEWLASGSSERDSLLRTLTLAQRAGATVNLTHWHGPYPNPRQQMRDFALMIRDLRDTRGFTNIRYVTIQNEPNSFNMDMERYNRLYWIFDEECRSAGIRSDIQIIGGDLLANKQSDWFRNLANNLATVLDGYSVHMYQDYWDRNQQLARVTEVPLYVNNLPSEGRKPVYLMEFGLRGVRSGKEEPGKHRDGRPLYDTNELAMLNGWRMMESLNRGYVAAVWWDLADLRYDNNHLHYGLLGEPSQNFPKRPGYYLMYLFTHTTKPGWRALQIEGGGARDTLVSAVQGTAGNITVFALNRATEQRTITIAGLPRNKPLRQLTWNAWGTGKLVDDGPLQTPLSGTLSLTAPPESIIALTTAQPTR